MWIITKKGFLSIVAFDPTKDKEKRSNRERKSWGKNPVLVRARLMEDIEQIRPYWSKLRVYEDKSADYSARAIVPRSRFMEFLWAAGWEIDYGSHFKEVARDNSPGTAQIKSSRYTAMMACWTALSRMQPTAPYGYYGGTGYGTGSSYGSGGSTSSGYWDKDKDIKGSQLPAVTSGPKKTVQALDVPFERDKRNPLTVKEMCEALLELSPNQINTTIACKYAAYDIWCKADDSYQEPLAYNQLISIIYDLIDDPETTKEACDDYAEILQELEAQLNELQNEVSLGDLPDDEDLPDESGESIVAAISALLSADEDRPAVLAGEEAK